MGGAGRSPRQFQPIPYTPEFANHNRPRPVADIRCSMCNEHDFVAGRVRGADINTGRTDILGRMRGPGVTDLYCDRCSVPYDLDERARIVDGRLERRGTITARPKEGVLDKMNRFIDNTQSSVQHNVKLNPAW